MTIDIIDLNDPEYSDLSPVQLAMVRAAQTKKDKITSSVNEQYEEMAQVLMGNNFCRCTELGQYKRMLQAAADAQVDAIREDLLLQLAYEALGSEGDENGPYRYPENPNYNLSYSQRFLVVRNYYMEATDDPDARLKAFAMDSLARTYLGEYYQTLYDLLASYC